MVLLWMTVRSSYILVCNYRHAKWANLKGNNPVPQSSMDAAFIRGALRGAGGTSKRAITVVAVDEFRTSTCCYRYASQPSS